MYNFTGVQHTKSGDVTIPVLGYDTRDGYKQKYHHEMDYAMSNDDFLGLSILVFDNNGNTVFQDNWVRETQPTPEPVEE